MPRKQKQYHFIYKTICQVTNAFYYGMHSTNSLDDGYLGSGKRLKYSINKHGKENHSIEILEFLPSRKDLIERETDLITEDMLKDPNCMNLKPGGSGGFSSDTHKKNWVKAGSIAGRKQILKLMNDPIWKEKIRTERSNRWLNDDYRKHMLTISANAFKGKTHSLDTKIRIGKANSIKQTGSKNSQYGTRWITNGIINKKISKYDPLPNNWLYGRTIKSSSNG